MTGHEHRFDLTLAAWPSGPDGECDRLMACACGSMIDAPHGETELPLHATGDEETKP